MIGGSQWHIFGGGKYLVTAARFVPIHQRRRHVHFFHNLAPSHTCVISAKRDLAFLSCVGDDAHLSAAEVIIKQVLKPHARNKQEIPAVGSPPVDSVGKSFGLLLPERGSTCADAEFL